MEVIISNHSRIVANLDLLRELAEEVLNLEKVDTEAELSLVLADEDEIQRLNAQYREIDSPTDVLSFPQFQDDLEGPHLLGDVIISPQIAQAQAIEHRHSLEKEMAVLLIHGILHLLGFSHETPEDRSIMQEREEKILNYFLVEKRIQ